MKPATYARYSSDLQRVSSIEDQQRRCCDDIARRGWPAPQHLSDSEIGGTIASGRPGYQQLLALARAHEINVIVVDELSRLTRDPEELAGLRKRLKFWGCDLIAILDGVDTVNSPAAAAAVIALGAYRNEAELEAIAHRTRRGLEGRVRAGMHAGGAIYGYRTRAVHADRPGDPPGTGEVIGFEYLIHAQEAEIVRQIFEWYASGLSSRAIAAKLNEQGIPSPALRWRNRTGLRGTWAHSSIQGSAQGRSGILNNEKYNGQLIWNRTHRPRDPERDNKKALRLTKQDEWTVVDAPELRIVSPELWEAVKARQRTRSLAYNGTKAVAHTSRLLSGLLRCGECGGAYSIRGAATYRCQARYDRGATVCESMASVNAANAERAVLDYLGELLREERMTELWQHFIKQRQQASQPAAATDKDSLLRQLAEAETEAARLVEALGRGALITQLEARMRQVEARMMALKAELERVDTREPAPVTILPAAIQHLTRNLQQAISEGRGEGLKKMVMSIVDRIEVRAQAKEGRIRPTVTLGLELKGDLQMLLGLPSIFTSGRAQEASRPLVILPERREIHKIEVGLLVRAVGGQA